MSRDGISLGFKGEELAVEFLESKGYKIINRNYKTRLGEIDIIAQDADVLCFIEVKTRTSSRFGSAREAVSATKQKQISKAALSFIKDRNILNKKCRFDVVSIDFSCARAKLELIKNAFELYSKFLY